MRRTRTAVILRLGAGMRNFRAWGQGWSTLALEAGRSWYPLASGPGPDVRTELQFQLHCLLPLRLRDRFLPLRLPEAGSSRGVGLVRVPPALPGYRAGE